MNPNDYNRRTGVRYQPDEKPPMALAFGLGLQLAILSVAATVLVPAIIIRAAGGTESYRSWAVFAAVAVCGATTMLQAVRFGQIGSGYVLLMSISGASIAVSITALAEGGPAMLATLVVVSSVVPLALSARLSLLRRILTPTVTGTVIMLIPVTVMSHVFNMLKDVPDGVPAVAAPLSAFATVLVIAGSVLKGRGCYASGHRSSASSPGRQSPGSSASTTSPALLRRHGSVFRRAHGRALISTSDPFSGRFFRHSCSWP